MTGGSDEITTTVPTSPSSGGPWRVVAGFVLLALGLSWIPWLTILVTTGDPFADPIFRHGPASLAALPRRGWHNRSIR